MAQRGRTFVLVWLGSLMLACGDGTSPDSGLQGDYALRLVHIADTLPQPVPAVHVVGTTRLSLSAGDWRR
jgi:hypothetical protein